MLLFHYAPKKGPPSPQRRAIERTHKALKGSHKRMVTVRKGGRHPLMLEQNPLTALPLGGFVQVDPKLYVGFLEGGDASVLVLQHARNPYKNRS